MKIDWDKTEDCGDAYMLPEGEHLCRVAACDERTSNNGTEFWNVRLEVIDGEHKGLCVFDKLFFSEKSLPRLKFICGILGLAVTGQVELEPGDLVGKMAVITVEHSNYTTKEGNVRKQAKVPYRGYSSYSSYSRAQKQNTKMNAAMKEYKKDDEQYRENESDIDYDDGVDQPPF